VAEQPRLHVLRFQGLAQQRVVEQVDLADRQVVGCAPVGVHLLQLFRREDLRLLLACMGAFVHGMRFRFSVPGTPVVLVASDHAPSTGRAMRRAPNRFGD
jgi:ribosome biogenesis protein Nip4